MGELRQQRTKFSTHDFLHAQQQKWVGKQSRARYSEATAGEGSAPLAESVTGVHLHKFFI